MSLHFEVEKELSLKVMGHGDIYAKRGSMIAYKGNFRFERKTMSLGRNIVRDAFQSVKKKFTGEGLDLMLASGSGTLFLADEGRHVGTITLQQGHRLSVESSDVLAFSKTVNTDVRMLGVGVLSQKGFFTSTFTANQGSETIAILSTGNPIQLETPCCVDPDAVVAWSGPDPSIKTDINWKTLIGKTSGESYMFEFKQPGHVVIVQPFERSHDDDDDDSDAPTKMLGGLSNLFDALS